MTNLQIVAAPDRRTRPVAVIYGRHSTADQTSASMQLEVCRRRCEERGWHVRYVVKDEATSGAKLSRAGYNRVLELADLGRVDIVVCWKMDRLVRSMRGTMDVEEFLRERGVALHSCTEEIDTTTAQGRFLFNSLANLAEMERNLGIERTRDAMYCSNTWSIAASRSAFLGGLPLRKRRWRRTVVAARRSSETIRSWRRCVVTAPTLMISVQRLPRNRHPSSFSAYAASA